MAVSPGSRVGIEVALLVGVTVHTARAMFFAHEGDVRKVDRYTPGAHVTCNVNGVVGSALVSCASHRQLH